MTDDTNLNQPADDLLARAVRVLDRAEQQLSLISNPVGGTCPIFYDDCVFNVALPWASFDPYQYKIASRHGVIDTVVLTQLFDLLPSIEGRALIDVGSYTGLQALVMRQFMKPSVVHMIEPQKVMRASLERTIAANPEGAAIHLSDDIIGEDGATMGRAATRADRLSETAYLRKDNGKLSARGLDALGIQNVGLINLDIPGPKIYALRGAAALLRGDRPAVLTNLSGRDAPEIGAYMDEHDYEFVRVGDHAALYLPK